MAHVFRTNGSETAVKNLGWLLRHTSEITLLEGRANGLNGNEAALVATGDGWVFYSPFASKQVLFDWLHRRALRGIPVDINWTQTTTLADLRRAAA